MGKRQLGKKIYSAILVLFISFLFTHSSGVSVEKDYALIYFRYESTGFNVKVYPDNPNKTQAKDTDFIIAKKGDGDYTLLLMRHFPAERELDAEYSYRVVFYRPQTIGENKYEIPIYSFTIRFDGEDLIVKYPPSRAVPEDIRKNNLEKVFHKEPGSNKYYIKDYTGKDFMLSPKMRIVKFTGYIKDDEGKYIPIDATKRKLTISLIYQEESETSEGDIFKYQNMNIIDIPINVEIAVGLFPYKIKNGSGNERFSLTALLKNNMEIDELVIHFGEVWKNLYEQALIFEDTGKFLDIYFDYKLFNLEYIIGNKSGVIKGKYFLSIPMNKYDGKKVILRLQAKDFASRFMEFPKYDIQFTIDASLNAKDLIQTIHTNYLKTTKILQGNSLYCYPVYKTSSLGIFSDPSGARIKYKKLEPVSDKGSSKYVDLGESPLLIEELEYGRYLFIAEWYSIPNLHDEIDVYRQQIIVEFSDTMPNKYTKNIKYLEKKGTKIPYINFKLAISEKLKLQKPLGDTDQDKMERIQKEASLYLFNYVNQNQKNSIIKAVEGLIEILGISSIRKTGVLQYYIQLGAIELTNFKNAVKWLQAFMKKYYLNNTDYVKHYSLDNFRVAFKSSKYQIYLVLLNGPYTYDEMILHQKIIKGYIKDAFGIDDTSLIEWKVNN